MPTSAAHAMRSPQQGVALVVTLIVTMLTLVVIVTVISITTTNAFSSNRASVQSTQGLMAAQSGLDTLIPRMKAAGFNGSIFSAECWLEGNSNKATLTTMADPSTCTNTTRNIPTLMLGDATIADGPRADVDIIKMDKDASTVTVQSTGRIGAAGAGVGTKTVLTQDVKLVRLPSLNVSPPAALTACTAIKGTGNSTIDGGSQGGTAILPVKLGNANVTVTGAPTQVSAVQMSWPTKMTVSDPTYPVGRGSYISVNGQIYAVTASETTKTPAGDKLEIWVSYANTAPAAGTSLSGSLNVVPFAIRRGGSVTATGVKVKIPKAYDYDKSGTTQFDTYHIPFSDPSGIYIGDVLYVEIDGKKYAVTVTGKGYENDDPEKGYVEVARSVTYEAANLYATGSGTTTITSSNYFLPPTADQLTALKPGTAFSRYIAGGTSSSTINGETGGTTGGIIQWGGSTNIGPAATANNSFLDCTNADGLFKQVFNGLTPSQYYEYVEPAKRLTSTSPSNMTGGLYWYGPKAYPSGASYSFSSGEVCGTGVLVVNGNLDMQGVCKSGFTGLLYVMGTLKNTGGSTVTGAVIVQGVGYGTGTDLSGGMGVIYDQSAVMRATKDLSRLTFSMVKGSWRQQ